MRCKIITVEIADPDFGVHKFGHIKVVHNNPDLVALAACELSSELHRSPGQIMRVHVYNCNLPAPVAANRNRPY